VTCEPTCVQHEVMRYVCGISGASFYAPSDRDAIWNISVPDGSSTMQVLAFNDRGAAVFQMPGDVGLCTTFHFNHFYPATVVLVKAFTDKLLSNFQSSQAEKEEYYQWMCINGEMGRLSLDKLANTKGLAEEKEENIEAILMTQRKPFKPSTPRSPRCLLMTPPRTAVVHPALSLTRQAYTPSTSDSMRSRKQNLLSMSVARTSTSLPRLRRRGRKNCSTPRAESFCKHKLFTERTRLDGDVTTRVPELYHSGTETARRAECKERTKWLYGPLKFSDSSLFDPLDTRQTLSDPYTNKPRTPEPYIEQFSVDRGDAILNRQAWMHGPFRFT